jgi:hypothetical protein
MSFYFGDLAKRKAQVTELQATMDESKTRTRQVMA